MKLGNSVNRQLNNKIKTSTHAIMGNSMKKLINNYIWDKIQNDTCEQITTFTHINILNN